MGYRGRERTVLVMWEYSCAHSPIWSRCDDLDTGPIDARELGLPEDLRDDLADWNDRCETAADPSGMLSVPVTARARRALQAEAFTLAARVQRALGDDWTVWCLAGGGHGGMRDRGMSGLEARTSGAPVLLRSGGPVTWTPAAVEPALGRFDAALVGRVGAWRDSADRLPPAEHGADALELAGALHAALPSGRVLWFGGEDVPA